MPSIPLLQERLGDELIELRPIAEWDIPEVLIAHQDDRDMYRRLGLEKPPTGARLGSEVEHYEDELAAGRSVILTIVEPGRNDCRGRVRAHAIDWDAGTAELGIWVAPDYRGRGFAGHALRIFSAWLFQTVGLQRLAMVTEADNEPLLRAGAAAGFTRRDELDPAGPDRASVALRSGGGATPPGGGTSGAGASGGERRHVTLTLARP